MYRERAATVAINTESDADVLCVAGGSYDSMMEDGMRNAPE